MDNWRPAGGRTGEPGAQVQSVDRALAILEYLAERGSGGVTEIARRLGVHKSTAFRLLMALENRHLVEQVEERGRYRLGFGLIRLAGATSAQLDLTRVGRPVCARLAAELGETVNLAVLDAGTAVNIAQEHGDSLLGARNWIGRRTPLHATASGKILLAHASGEPLDVLPGGRPERFTERTVIDPAALRAELADVLARGWAGCTEELEIGLNAVAAPVRDADGLVVASVSVFGPSYRLAAADLPRVATRVMAGAEQISMGLGFRPAA